MASLDLQGSRVRRVIGDSQVLREDQVPKEKRVLLVNLVL